MVGELAKGRRQVKGYTSPRLCLVPQQARGVRLIEGWARAGSRGEWADF